MSESSYRITQKEYLKAYMGIRDKEYIKRYVKVNKSNILKGYMCATGYSATYFVARELSTQKQYGTHIKLLVEA
jgi:hypothetical protein